MPEPETELRARLIKLHKDYERVCHAVRDAQNRQRYLSDAGEVAAAEAEELTLLREMNALMDRLRALEARLSMLKRGEKPRFQ